MVIIVNKTNLFKKIIHAFLIFILFSYSWIFQLIPVILFNLDVEKLNSKTGVILTTFSSLVLGTILFFIYKKDIIKEFKTFKNNFGNNFDIGAKYWFFGLVLMISFNTIIMKVLSGGQAANEQAVQGMITALPGLMLINAGVLAPWSEELVFRKSIKEIFNNKWLYATVAGLLFGLAHVVGQTSSWIDWLFILPYGSLGFSFALSYYDTDSIFTPIMFHVIHNVALVIFSII